MFPCSLRPFGLAVLIASSCQRADLGRSMNRRSLDPSLRVGLDTLGSEVPFRKLLGVKTRTMFSNGCLIAAMFFHRVRTISWAVRA